MDDIWGLSYPILSWGVLGCPGVSWHVLACILWPAGSLNVEGRGDDPIAGSDRFPPHERSVEELGSIGLGWYADMEEKDAGRLRD